MTAVIMMSDAQRVQQFFEGFEHGGSRYVYNDCADGLGSFTPLQIADFFAYEAMKENHRSKLNPTIHSTRACCTSRPTLHSGARISYYKAWIVELKRGFEVLAGMFRVPCFWYKGTTSRVRVSGGQMATDRV